MSYDYDVMVIGAGAAGLTAAAVASNLGAHVLMVERDRLGGDCTWTGCIPSKALLSAAQAAHSAQRAHEFGVHVGMVHVDFADVMKRVRSIRADIYDEADRPEIYEEMGVDVRRGEAHFVDAHTIELDGVTRVTGRKIVIAAGASPAVPPISGLETVPYLTNESLFELETRPDHLIVLGAGPIGIEMAQAFHRLGSDVTVIDRMPRILQQDDAELAGLLQRSLEDEGVRFVLEADVESIRPYVERTRLDVEGARPDLEGAQTPDLGATTPDLGATTPDLGARTSNAGVVVTLKGAAPVRGSKLLVATGRRPNTDSLNLHAAGIEFDDAGITVDSRCRTSQSHIFAAGDVTGRLAFTHMGEHMAKTAVMNALLKVPFRIDEDHTPSVTYADPELAHVGRTEEQLGAEGASFETYRFPYGKIDRAVTDRATTGAIKVHARALDGKILGATVLGARAGELISEFTLAMRNGITLRQISDTIHPYPSYGLGVRRVADQWYIRRRSPRLVRMLQRVFGYNGPVLEYDEDVVL